MTTAVTNAFNPLSRPAHLATTDATTNILGGTGARRISTEGKFFTPTVGGKPMGVKSTTLTGVIIGATPKVARLYYDSPYKQGVIATPSCYSPNGETPAANARAKQSDACITCPRNVKGSGGGDRRACSFSKRIAILIDGHVYQLTLPATSIFDTEQHPDGRMPLKTYGSFLQANNAPVTGVLTELSFDDRQTYPKVLMKPVSWLDEVGHAAALKAVESTEVARILEYNFEEPAPQAAPTFQTPVTPALSIPGTPPAQAQPASPAPVATAEPAKVSSGNAPAQSKEDLVSKALAAWDD